VQPQQRVFRSSCSDVTTADTANVSELSKNQHTHLELEAVPPTRYSAERPYSPHLTRKIPHTPHHGRGPDILICGVHSGPGTNHISYSMCRLRLKCDSTREETRFRLSAKRTSPFKSAGASVKRLLAAEVCASAVVMLDTPCSEVVRRVLATHSIRQFPLQFLSRESPCAITFQLDSTGRHFPLS